MRPPGEGPKGQVKVLVGTKRVVRASARCSVHADGGADRRCGMPAAPVAWNVPSAVAIGFGMLTS